MLVTVIVFPNDAMPLLHEKGTKMCASKGLDLLDLLMHHRKAHTRISLIARPPNMCTETQYTGHVTLCNSDKPLKAEIVQLLVGCVMKHTQSTSTEEFPTLLHKALFSDSTKPLRHGRAFFQEGLS